MRTDVSNEDTKVKYTVTLKCCLIVVYKLVIKENLSI